MLYSAATLSFNYIEFGAVRRGLAGTLVYLLHPNRMVGTALDWTFLESFLPQTQDPQFRRSALASSFVAALELARRGRVDIAQDAAFAPIRLRTASCSRPRGRGRQHRASGADLSTEALAEVEAPLSVTTTTP